jgi:hypothetical protein
MTGILPGKHQVGKQAWGYLWLTLAVVLIALVLWTRPPHWICARMGVDFRGYYASAQIAWQHGFAAVYDPQTQAEFQARLLMHCPSPVEPPLLVAMPYLPVFVLLFLPLPLLDFTTSYLVYSFLQVLILAWYGERMVKAGGGTLGVWQRLAWLISIPMIFNLFLGQSNVFLVICLGEFALALARQRYLTAGACLGLFLIKPNALILLLPGLILARRWRALAGFAISSGMILAGSLLLAGVEGVIGALHLAVRFAGPLIETAATMMNWRALAIHLTSLSPSWFAWSIATVGMVGVSLLVLALWLRPSSDHPEGPFWLVLAAYAGTCAVTWHSHIYMLMPGAPLLLFLDARGKLPVGLKLTWLLAPPLVFLGVFLLHPGAAEEWFGLGMLGLNLWILFQSSAQLLNPGPAGSQRSRPGGR